MESLPTFHDQGRIYRADTCEPLVDAVYRSKTRLKALARGAYPGERMPSGILPELRSVGFWDAGHDQDWGLGEHRNEGIEITYLETGKLDFFVDGEWHTLRPGDLTITRPWQPHSVGGPFVAAGRLYWIILDVGVRQPHQSWKWPSWLVLTRPDLAYLTDILRLNEQPVRHATKEIGRCFAETGRLLQAADVTQTLGSRLAMLINEVFVWLLEMLRSREVVRQPSLTTADSTIKMFLRQLEQSVDQPWTLEAMAEQTGFKRSRFSHYCRMITNQTPHRYLQYLRVQKALSLMREQPSRSFTDIALDCGFSSSQHFSTVFRRSTGTTPRTSRASLSRFIDERPVP